MAGQLALIKVLLPESVRRWLRQQQRRYKFRPPLGQVRFGSLRRVEPIGENFGFNRGTPIDRYYIEQFLAEHEADIKGHVLEIGDHYYTTKFGGDKVTSSDVLNVDSDIPGTTIIADLARADHLPAETFDCIICTQTLPCIYDVKAAMRNLYRVLKPGGVLLTTNPGIGQLSGHAWETWGQYWRFTSKSIERLLQEVFPPEKVKVDVYGNVLAATAFLYGISAHELRPEELNHRDWKYQVSIVSRSVKSLSPVSLVALYVISETAATLSTCLL